MTEKQKRFCEYYAQNPNATQAAIAAGFSAKTAYSSGERLLRNVEIQQCISELTAPARGQRIATAEEIQSLWTSVLRDENMHTRDRLEASKLLYAATAGATQPGGGELDIVDAEPEEESLQFALPYNFRDCVEASAIQIDGKIVPLPNCEDRELLIYVMPEDFVRYEIFRSTNGEIDIADFSEPEQAVIVKKYKAGELITNGN